MFGATRRDLSMRRTFGVLGWLGATLYFGVLAAFNVNIGWDLLHLPSGFEPGWWPLVEADALYGGGGILTVLLVRLAWRRWLARAAVRHIPAT